MMSFGLLSLQSGARVWANPSSHVFLVCWKICTPEYAQTLLELQCLRQAVVDLGHDLLWNPGLLTLQLFLLYSSSLTQIYTHPRSYIEARLGPTLPLDCPLCGSDGTEYPDNHTR
jgi:hypothetical protein